MTITPKALAGYAKNLYEKDTEGKFASNKYKFEVRMPKGDKDVEVFVKKMLKLHQEAGDNKYPPVRDGDKVAKETENDKRAAFAKNHWLMTVKSNYAPAIVDSQKNPLGKVQIMGGDEVKISFTPLPYDMLGGGISNQLKAVMLIEKKAGAFANADEFETEDGYVASESDDDEVAEDDDDF